MLAALLAMMLVFVPSSPALAATLTVSGTVKASDLTTGDSLTLAGDTTLVMDQAITLTCISGREYGLTITGSDNLTVRNESTSSLDTENSGIYVASLSSEVDITASSSNGHGIYAASGPITIDGNVEARGNLYGIAGVRGLAVTGNVVSTASIVSGIQVVGGSLVVGGGVTAKSGGSYGILFAGDGDMIIGGNVVAEGDTFAIYSTSSPIQITGNVDVRASEVACIMGNGSLDIGGSASATPEPSCQYGFYAGQDIHVVGTVTVSKVIVGGLYTNRGSIALDGDVTTSGQTYGIFAHQNITLGGRVSASGAMYGIATKEGALNITSGRVEATGDDYAIAATGGINIIAPLDVVEPTGGSVGQVTSGGELYATIVDRSGMAATHAIIDVPTTTVPIYRMYNTKTSEHLYTRSKKEYDSCGSGTYKDWRAEGVAWRAPAPGSSGAKPVYRLYNLKSGDHHYTTSKGERDSLVASGQWRDEGTAFWSAPKNASGAIPIYRVYNGRLKRGQHHYTKSATERDSLVKNSGWRDEGVGFYGYKA